MPIHARAIPLRLLGLAAVLAAGCQHGDLHSQTRAPEPASAHRSACEKADELWNDRILASRYETLPALTSPGIFDLFSLLNSHFSAKAFTSEGDELEEGRRKVIHAFGTEARMRLLIAPGSPGGYTGILAKGAECVIARFSLASKPTADASIPALALKIYVAGAEPSVNLLLMHSVDGQVGHDFFAHTFSNIIPPAQAFSTRVLAAAFERSTTEIGAKDSNPGRLTLENLTSVQTDGMHVTAPRTPYQLLFVPTQMARTLMPGATTGDDFRIRLADLPVGQAVYDVLAVAEGASVEAATPVGQLVLTSAVVASRYGDERLFFKHHTSRNTNAEPRR